MVKMRPRELAGRRKDLRYHPVPEMGNAPVDGLSFSSNGPSIAQSCGRRSSFQLESSNSGFSAPSASLLLNRQFASKLTRRSPEIFTAASFAVVAAAASVDKVRAEIAKISIRRRIFPVMFSPDV